ncbi:MAG: hypothetical protein PHO37_14715 [Kiritimatiellae bacterium]|nr:hypothetical protein [Kiritimatiellia bacterium]
MYPFIYGKVIFSFRQCEAIGGIRGAEQSLPWHTPGYSDSSFCTAVGCTCDDGPHWTIGFSHSAVNTCFTGRHPEESEEDKRYHHCLGIVWYNHFSVETNWLAELPAAYRALAAPTMNWLGSVSRDPEPATTNLWANKVNRPQ